MSRFRSSSRFAEPHFELRNRKDTSKPIDIVRLWFRSQHDEPAAATMRTPEPPHYRFGYKRPFRPVLPGPQAAAASTGPWGYPRGGPPNVSIMPYFWAPNTLVYSALTTARLILGGFGATSSSWKWGLDGAQRRESQQAVTAFETAQESLVCLRGNRVLAGCCRLDYQFHAPHTRFRSPAGKCDFVRRSFCYADARQQFGVGTAETLRDRSRTVRVYDRQGGA